MDQFTHTIPQGQQMTAEELLPLVYEELRKLAAHRIANEAPGQTLQPTALVHEAWLRLIGDKNPAFQGSAHFFAAAAEAMRRVLIDNARRKKTLKRAGGGQRTELNELDLMQPCPSEELLAIDEALDRLAVIDSAAADLVKLRYFVGMNMPEAAVALGISLRSAERTWAYAKAWLRREIGSCT